MRKLIDAEEAKKALTGWETDPTDEEIEFAIDRIPTVDAEPVTHSHWKYYHIENRAVCMNCGFERDLDYNFGRAVSCPNCGAKMDGRGK